MRQTLLIAAADERLDDSHVRDGIINRRRDISIFEDCSRKEIRLDPILVANVELNALDDAIYSPAARDVAGRSAG